MVFRHQPLTAPLQTRLFWLAPSHDFEASIHCHVAVVSLSQMPPYEALSYAWDSWEGNVEITCSHIPSNGSEELQLAVTRNCDRALRHLRLPDRQRLLWVDAICIDQTSQGDKDIQLPQMKNIYFLAQRVVLWLGTEDPSTKYMFSQVEAAEIYPVVEQTLSLDCMRCIGSFARLFMCIRTFGHTRST